MSWSGLQLKYLLIVKAMLCVCVLLIQRRYTYVTKQLDDNNIFCVPTTTAKLLYVILVTFFACFFFVNIFAFFNHDPTKGLFDTQMRDG